MNRYPQLSVLLLVVPFLSQAQPPGMTELQMQEMMQKASEMQACFAKVDQQALMAVSQKAQALESEIRSLCESGKKAAAQARAIEFGLTLSRDKNIQAAKKCGEIAKGMMPTIPIVDYPADKAADKDSICDGY